MPPIFPKLGSFFDRKIVEVHITQEKPNKVRFYEPEQSEGQISITKSNYPEAYELLKEFEKKLFVNVFIPERTTVSFTISPVEVQANIEKTLQTGNVNLLRCLVSEYQLDGTEITVERYLQNNQNINTTDEVYIFIRSVGTGSSSMNIDLWTEESNTIYISPPIKSTIDRVLRKHMSQIIHNVGFPTIDHYLRFTTEISPENRVLSITMDIPKSEFKTIEKFPKLY